MTIDDTQLTRADLREMSAAEIGEARRAGRLANLLGQQPEPAADGDDQAQPDPEKRAPKPNPAQGATGSREPDRPITDSHQLRGLSPAEINQARRDGRLDQLLRRH